MRIHQRAHTRIQLIFRDPGPRPRVSAAAAAAVITSRTALLVFSDAPVADDEWNKGPSPVQPDSCFVFFFFLYLFFQCVVSTARLGVCPTVFVESRIP